MTVSGYEKLKKQMEELQAESKMQMIKNSRVKEIAIIDVIPATDKHPDLFTALVKGYVVTDIEDWSASAPSVNHDDIIRKFSERWCFARQGDWWLLDEMKK